MTKTYNRKKIAKFATLFTMFLCLTLCISFAELFSSLITVGGFSSITSGDVKQPSFSVYAISLYATETKVQAREMADITKRKNGAGYIWQGSECYYVFASCYETEADAKKVEQNLKENGTNCTIVKLDFSDITIKAEVTNEEKTTLGSAVHSFKDVYKKLYDLSVSIDTNLHTEIQAKVLLGDITSEFAKVKTNYETLFNSKLTSNLLDLKLSLTNVQNILNELAEFSSNEIPYTSQVKNTYFKVLYEYYNLSKIL